MAVTEAQQLFAAKLAYVDLDKAYSVIYKMTHEKVTIKDAIKYLKENGEPLGEIAKCIDSKTGELLPEYHYAENWTITAVVNQNTTNEPTPANGNPVNTGLFACILDTGDDNILACRGSENMMDLQNYRQDWYNADLKLLNSTMTQQEEALEAFIRDHKDLLANKPWVSTGHSLGGALADYAAIMSVVHGIDNYSGTTNFDGPGHSGEFIEKYKDEIAQVCKKMRHKVASIVGNLLSPLPGVEPEYIKVYDDKETFDRHLMKNWDLDENNATQPGEPRGYETVVGDLTRYIDKLPAPVGNFFVCALNLIIEGIFWGASFSSDHPVLFKAFITAIVVFALLHPGRILEGLVTIAKLISVIFIMLGLITVGKLLIEGMEWLLKEVVDILCNTISWLKGKATELYNATIEFLRSIPGYIRSITPGSKYVSGNPYFRADPALLRDYARRLAAVNARLASLDRDLDQLYYQVGLLDVLDIMQANIITHYSARIRLAQAYLNSAADTLENADNQALRYMGG